MTGFAPHLRALLAACLLPLAVSAQDAPQPPPRPQQPQDARPQPAQDARPSLQDHEIRIVEVRHADAVEIAATIDRLLQRTSSYANLNVYRPRNAIVVASDEQAVVERIVGLIGELDVAPEPTETARVEVESVSLLHANACELTEVLCRLAPTRADLRIVPDARTNNLWLSGEPTLVKTFVEIARTMDKQTRDTGSATGALNYPDISIPQKHADAAELAPVLATWLSRPAAQGSYEPAGACDDSNHVHVRGIECAITPAADRKELAVRAEPAVRELIKELVAKLDVPIGPRKTFIYSPN